MKRLKDWYDDLSPAKRLMVHVGTGVLFTWVYAFAHRRIALNEGYWRGYRDRDNASKGHPTAFDQALVHMNDLGYEQGLAHGIWRSDNLQAVEIFKAGFREGTHAQREAIDAFTAPRYVPVQRLGPESKA